MLEIDRETVKFAHCSVDDGELFHFPLKITVSISSHSSEEEVAMTVECRCNYIFFYLFQIFISVNF